MAIDPISMPDAAAINYGENDVRHFSEGDAMDVPGISRPGRHLAARDVALANKLNDVIAVVNNREQFVPLPVLRTTLSPNSEEIIQNFRIPPGFEARAINAIVTSIPPSASAEVDIYYAGGYGNSTGIQIVSTSTEFTAGTQFYSNGEFILTLKNRGGVTLEMVASIQLTMRPLGDTSGILITSAAVAVPGPAGQAGPQGNQGNQGNPGGPGSPGLTWQGNWSNAVTYSATDVVFWLGSSWKSTTASNIGNQPDLSPSFWTFVAQKGASSLNWQGAWLIGTTYNPGDTVTDGGSTWRSTTINVGHKPISYPADWSLVAQAGANGFRFRGAWNNPPLDSFGAYILNDVVNVPISGTSQTYVAIAAVPNAATSPPNSDWSQLFSSGSPLFGFAGLTGYAYAEADFISVGTDNQYTGFAISYPGTVNYTLNQATVQDSSSGHGFTALRCQKFARWLGSMSFVLPGVAAGAAVNWKAQDVVASVTNAGTIISFGTQTTQHLTSTGTTTTAQAAGGQGYARTDSLDVPGFAVTGTAALTRIFQTGSVITVTNPLGVACDITLSIAGFQIF